VTDYFSILDLPRRPWLESDILHQSFLALSSAAHPDRFHHRPELDRAAAHARYTEINAAYVCLREPPSRVLHLLELESGGKPKEVQEIPHEIMKLFLEVGMSCRQADPLIAEKERHVSPLMKVQWFEKAQAEIERLQTIQTRLTTWREFLLKSLLEMNSAWEKAPPVGSGFRLEGLPLLRLEQVYRLLSYEARWSSQIQERIFQLAP
jgi:hypothetical protein